MEDDFKDVEPAFWQLDGVLMKTATWPRRLKRVHERGTPWLLGVSLGLAVAAGTMCHDLHGDSAPTVEIARAGWPPSANKDDQLVPVGHWARLSSLFDRRPADADHDEVDLEPLV